ncbi:MAG: hypothetical protein KJ623_00765 [Nanoarchaeota archaeon]|nr:hypothetical protein [Nanoarchaeota archaeon]MBU0963042.1 hypothetical protein [Nanoarchaeota archaeon]
MYNTTYYPQIKKFKEYFWGAGCVDTKVAAEEASKKPYFPPKDLEIVPCKENANGEWVPYKVIDDVLSETIVVD